MSGQGPNAPELQTEVHEGAAPAEAIALRLAVFVEEQDVSQRDEVDGHDGSSIHLLLRARGRVVACARLRPLGEGRAKVERVAVPQSLRGQGLGQRIMQAVEAEALRRGLASLVLHAQKPVIGFYADLGWRPVGPEFIEAGIPHQEMHKP